MTIPLRTFVLSDLRWDVEFGRCTATCFAFDQDGKPVARPGLPYGADLDAPTLRALWERATADAVLPPGVATPDFARVQALSARALALGCTWRAECDTGRWSALCVDEFRSRTLDDYDHTGATLEGALETAVTRAAADASWLDWCRNGWPGPESWLRAAMGRIENGEPAPYIL